MSVDRPDLSSHPSVTDLSIFGVRHDAPPIATISAESLKLPPFWPADSEIWFAQVEACRRITSQRSRFDYVVSSLTLEFATAVRDLLLKLPAYTVLKTQLTRRTALSEQRKLQQLLTGEELVDHKPTQLLRRMQQLLGDRPGVDVSFLRELFLPRMCILFSPLRLPLPP